MTEQEAQALARFRRRVESAISQGRFYLTDVPTSEGTAVLEALDGSITAAQLGAAIERSVD